MCANADNHELHYHVELMDGTVLEGPEFEYGPGGTTKAGFFFEQSGVYRYDLGERVTIYPWHMVKVASRV